MPVGVFVFVKVGVFVGVWVLVGVFVGVPVPVIVGELVKVGVLELTEVTVIVTVGVIVWPNEIEGQIRPINNPKRKMPRGFRRKKPIVEKNI